MARALFCLGSNGLIATGRVRHRFNRDLFRPARDETRIKHGLRKGRCTGTRHSRSGGGHGVHGRHQNQQKGTDESAHDFQIQEKRTEGHHGCAHIFDIGPGRAVAMSRC